MATSNKQTASVVSRPARHFCAMINKRPKWWRAVSHLSSLSLPLCAFTKCPLGHLACLSPYLNLFLSYLTSLALVLHPALHIQISYSTYWSKACSKLDDTIVLCILTACSIHTDEIREKMMSRLSAVYSTGAARVLLREGLGTETSIPMTGAFFWPPLVFWSETSVKLLLGY